MKHHTKSELHKKNINTSKRSSIESNDPHFHKPDSQQNNPIHFIFKQQPKPNPFEFSKIQKDVEKIVDQIIDETLKERHTILLAKMAKENILQYEPNTKELNTCHSSIKQLEDPLIMKSIDEINQFYCTEISSKAVKKVVQYLKIKQNSAKVMVIGTIIQNPKYGFNIGGMSFWNNSTDGQKTIRRKVPALRGTSRPYQGKDGSNNQQRSSSVDSNQFQREGLLVVTIYLCKFEKNFRSK